jgi:O-antigen/teichoic acid export membrane protein
MLAIILYLFPIIIFSFGYILVPLVFSAKWAAALPALYWYSAGAFFLPIIATLGQGILAVGKSKAIFWSSLLTAIFGWLIAIVFVHAFGFAMIAAAYFFSSLLMCLFYLAILKKNGFNMSIFSILKAKIIAVILCLIFSLSLNLVLPNNVAWVLAKLILSTISYCALMFIFSRKDTKELSGLIGSWANLKKYA